MQTLVTGSASIDAFPINASHKISERWLELRQGERLLRIECLERLVAGGKHFAVKPFYSEFQNFEREEKFGGGGLNTVRELRRLGYAKLTYLDLSTPALDTSVPGENLADLLWNEGITPVFLSMRPMPLNLVLGERADKVIIKNPLSPGIAVVSEMPQRNLVAQLIVNYEQILFNSVKDEWLAEILANAGGYKYAVITGSLEPDFVIDVVLPRCACQFNYDEFGGITGIKGDEQERFEAGIEALYKLLPIQRNILVTLGGNGALVSCYQRVYHVRLNREARERVAEKIIKNTAGLTGAGDVFAAHAFTHLKEGGLEAAIEGCLGAVHYLGCVEVTRNEFEVGLCLDGKKPRNYFSTARPQAALSSL